MRQKAKFIYHNFPLALGGLIAFLLLLIICLSFHYYQGLWSAIGVFIGFLIGDTVKYVAIKNNWS